MQATPKSDALRVFLERHLSGMEDDGGTGSKLKRPDFELSARDYLQFAERELSSDSLQSRINCVSHLKRAAECQMDTFLHAYNLLEYVRKKALRFETKLEFLRDAALFSSRSLGRFNQMRNRVEHDYKAPDVTDLEVFYDLVQALVAVLESAALLFARFRATDYIVYESEMDDARRIGTFAIEYSKSSPEIEVSWDVDHNEQRFVVNIEELSEFKFFFRAYVLLARRDSLDSDRYLLSQIRAGAG